MHLVVDFGFGFRISQWNHSDLLQWPTSILHSKLLPIELPHSGLLVSVQLEWRVKYPLLFPSVSHYFCRWTGFEQRPAALASFALSVHRVPACHIHFPLKLYAAFQLYSWISAYFILQFGSMQRAMIDERDETQQRSESWHIDGPTSRHTVTIYMSVTNWNCMRCLLSARTTSHWSP